VPLVEITLIRGKSRQYVRAIADGVQRALHEAYTAPIDDRFPVIRQCARDDLIYDPSYLGVRRTDDIVFVHVIAGDWRDTAAKKAFYQRVADLLAEHPGVRREDVQIVISSNTRDEWSLGGGVASYVKD
jgi:phenylpyruvate tautomerase PptA (4-oxalocrotonate tautomerase family)